MTLCICAGILHPLIFVAVDTTNTNGAIMDTEILQAGVAVFTRDPRHVYDIVDVDDHPTYNAAMAGVDPQIEDEFEEHMPALLTSTAEPDFKFESC